MRGMSVRAGTGAGRRAGRGAGGELEEGRRVKEEVAGEEKHLRSKLRDRWRGCGRSGRSLERRKNVLSRVGLQLGEGSGRMGDVETVRVQLEVS